MFIAPEDAIKLVRDPLVGDTIAPPAVERLVWQRIAGLESLAFRIIIRCLLLNAVTQTQ